MRQGPVSGFAPVNQTAPWGTADTTIANKLYLYDFCPKNIVLVLIMGLTS